MANEYSRDQQAVEPRAQTRGQRTPPPPQPVAPLLNEGLERVRESHC